MLRFSGLVLAISALFLLGGVFTIEAAILRDLQQGARGAEVRELQQILNRDPETQVAKSGLGSPGNETEYFGALTKNAVMRFQQKYVNEILAPAGLSRPTGFVGTRTRAALRRLIVATGDMLPPPMPSAANLKPQIISVTPSTITESPQEVTLSGINFMAEGNEVFIPSEGPGAFSNIASSDSKTLRFTIRIAAADMIKSQLADNPNRSGIIAAILQNMRIGKEPGIQTTQIPVTLSVRNANGESDTMSLILDMASLLQ